MNWQHFVIEHGRGARGDHLALITGQPIRTIDRLRSSGVCCDNASRVTKGFSELFQLWHGRSPRDEEWPPARRFHKNGEFEWLGPELALLATLVGQMDAAAIAKVLTARLATITKDPTALRSKNSVQVRMNRIGLQSTDVTGGLTVTDAAREIGSRAVVNHAIRTKSLRPRRVGRLLVIPHEQWSEWKSKRTFPPTGYIRLASIRKRLAVRSDKLSEFARAGWIPKAIRCHPFGAAGASTQYGVWYIDAKVANKLIADRRRGRPMPWHGKPMMDNLRATFKLWKSRQHPDHCENCKTIWRRLGAPITFEDYSHRYPPLHHGAKRHLTMRWSEGISVTSLARETHRSASYVTRAIANGVLRARRRGNKWMISHTDATRWKARRTPSGQGEKSWISLSTATKLYDFRRSELMSLVKRKVLKSKLGTDGPMRGLTYVPRQQCAELRERIGYTESEAAKRLQITVIRLRTLLRGLEWRGRTRIPIETIQAAQKRLESREGFTIAEAAKELKQSTAWIRDHIRAGTIRMQRTKWDARRHYISGPMLERLKAARHSPIVTETVSKHWLPLSEASTFVGVSNATLIRWADDLKVKRRASRRGWRYHRASIVAHARRYWRMARFKRAQRPAWLSSAA